MRSYHCFVCCRFWVLIVYFNVALRLRNPSRAKVRVSPGSAGKWRGFDIKILTPGRFSIAKGKAKSIDVSTSLRFARVLTGNTIINMCS